MGRSYAVASGKGGVGKTVTTANLGATLAAAGATVAVVDADLGMANLGDALGVDADAATVHDVLAGDAALADATYEGPAGLAVVPGSRDIEAFSRGDPAKLDGVIDALAAEYDYVFVDVGAGLSNDTVLPLGHVDEVILVSTAGRDALADASKTERMAERVGTPVAGTVLTRTDDDGPAAAGPAAAVLATIPDDPAVDAALAAGEPLLTHAPASPAAAAYRDLARALTGASVAEPDAAGGEDGGPSATDDGDPSAVEDEGDAATLTPDADPTDADPTDDGNVGELDPEPLYRGGSGDDAPGDEAEAVVIEDAASGGEAPAPATGGDATGTDGSEASPAGDAGEASDASDGAEDVSDTSDGAEDVSDIIDDAEEVSDTSDDAEDASADGATPDSDADAEDDRTADGTPDDGAADEGSAGDGAASTDDTPAHPARRADDGDDERGGSGGVLGRLRSLF